MPSEQACRKLGIGLTVLKRQCRKFGIKRWPFRKMKSLDRLITNVQKGITPGETGRVMLKSVEELEEQKRKMEECAIQDLDEQTKRLQQAYSKASHKMRRLAGVTPAVRVKPRTARPPRPPGAHVAGGAAKFAAGARASTCVHMLAHVCANCLHCMLRCALLLPCSTRRCTAMMLTSRHAMCFCARRRAGACGGR
jgi:hypothetical protein